MLRRLGGGPQGPTPPARFTLVSKPPHAPVVQDASDPQRCAEACAECDSPDASRARCIDEERRFREGGADVEAGKRRPAVGWDA